MSQNIKEPEVFNEIFLIISTYEGRYIQKKSLRSIFVNCANVN